MKKHQRKKKSVKRGRIFLLVVVIAAVTGGIILWNTPLSEIHVHGAAQYTEEEIKQLIFSKPSEQKFLYAWLRDKFIKNKQFPRILSYELEFKTIHSVDIYVRENRMVGCVSYGGSYLYFDKDGMIIESRTNRFEGVPIVEGLAYEEIVLGQKIKADSNEIFQNALRLADILQNRGIYADSIYCSYDNQLEFCVGKIIVKLGDSSYLEEKVTEYYAMQETLGEREGTLYLDNYRSQNPNQGFVFKEKTAQEEETSSENDAENKISEELEQK